MPLRLAFIGAGSIGFTRRLIRDLLSVPEFDRAVITLQDIDRQNLSMIRQLVEKDIASNRSRAVIKATLDHREAVRSARYVFNTARVGRLDAFQLDIDIPLKYGIDQCVGDTLCAGGIMYGQRGIPMILDLCRDIRTVAAKDCLLLNYANPNAMMTWAANQYGGVDCVGLCHGVQGGHRLIADAFGLPKDTVDIICAGINHQTWYTTICHKGKNLTGKLLAALERHPVYRKTEKVRIDMLKRFGYFSTESNGHLSEYVAWYRKRPAETKGWITMDTWIHGETGGYLRVCTEGRNWFETDFPNWLAGDPMRYAPEERGQEHGSYIVESLETGRIYRGHFNRVNGGVIGNLPADAIIEAPGYVDATGIHMAAYGDLPLGCAAVCNQSIAVQRLAVTAAVHADEDLLKQAMLLDPLVGAVCTPPEVWQLADEMLVAQAKWLPQYQPAITAARRRLKRGPLLKTRPVKGNRLRTRTVAQMRKNPRDAKRVAGAADKSR